jgi:hypothetical protein
MHTLVLGLKFNWTPTAQNDHDMKQPHLYLKAASKPTHHIYLYPHTTTTLRPDRFLHHHLIRLPRFSKPNFSHPKNFVHTFVQSCTYPKKEHREIVLVMLFS